MLEFPVDWSIVISLFIRDKISEWARFRSIVSKSKLTEEDAFELGKLVKSGRYSYLKKRGFL